MKLPAIFKRKEKDPRSQSFNTKVETILKNYGMVEAVQRKLLAMELYWRSYEFFKSKGDEEEEKQKFGADLMKILTNYGITDEKHQDSLLCEYFDALNETMGIEKR